MTAAIVSALAPDYTTKNGAQALSVDQQGYLRTQSAITNATALTSGTPATPGRSILITASVAGTVTLVLAGGSTCIVTVVVGDNIYPFAVGTATTGTATITRMYNLA